jgi:hypothetical protein
MKSWRSRAQRLVPASSQRLEIGRINSPLMEMRRICLDLALPRCAGDRFGRSDVAGEDASLFALSFFHQANKARAQAATLRLWPCSAHGFLLLT